MTHALELLDIEKSFGGVRALRGASLVAERGEILGLCGENGAGKSTILKILSGVWPRSSYTGTVRAFGVERAFTSTRDAEAAGIAIVHQELMLVPELSAFENMLLGREPGRYGLLDDDRAEAETHALLARFGVERDIDARAPVGSLGIGLQQVVEIVRALSRDAKILVLDEPTAALTQRESDRLMTWLRKLRDDGTTCIYVSHRMDEVFALCDRITVLRDGKTVGTVPARTTPPEDVVAMMVGRAIAAKGAKAPALAADAPAVLEVRGLSVPLASKVTDEAGARAFAVQNVSLTVRAGEVVAVCGAMGSGRTALLSTLFGSARDGHAGTVRVGGREIALDSPASAIAAGIAFVPEDRKAQGLVLGMNVAENLAIVPRSGRAGRLLEWLELVDEDAEEVVAAARIKDLSIRGDAAAEVATFSGGNQQKVAIGKWLANVASAPGAPSVMLLDEPTRGVDVGARDEIYALLEELGRRGAATVLASSDLGEVLRLAHRILVLRHGSVVAELDGRSATEEEIVALATGATGAHAMAADVQRERAADASLPLRSETCAP